jgi:DNA (cytosine-5)-methyltransferase 3A
MLSDVIDGAVSGVGTRGRKLKKDDLKYTNITNIRKDHKSNCIVTNAYGTGKYITNDNEIKNLTVTEMELLQTFDEGYTDVGLSKTARIKLIGNSWTKEVIIHLFMGLITKKNKYNLFFR